ncbi:MAG: thiamine phosphate synthase [Bacteroidota bacterium]
MKFIIISSEVDFPAETRQVQNLFEAGLELFHLRKKNYSEDKIRKFIEEIPKKYYNRIVLHSHYHLAEEYHLSGIHIKLPIVRIPNLCYSTSFHSLNEIKDCKYDYAFLSPIFDSISKQGYKSKFMLHKFSQSKSELINAISDKNIIALGGIDEDKIKIVRELGFWGIALLGAIWNNKNPVEKFKRIKEKCYQKDLIS